jgi:hypothetical protein
MYLHTNKHTTHMIYNYARTNHPITMNMNIKMTNENWEKFEHHEHKEIKTKYTNEKYQKSPKT